MSCSDASGALGGIGAALGIALANVGAAYGIAVSFYGYIALAQTPRVDRLLLIKGLVPAVMASVRGVYGLIISILIVVGMGSANYSIYKAWSHFFAGLCVGVSGIGSGYCMGVVGNYGLRAVGVKPRIFMGILLIIIFAEALGLYGLIIALIVISNGDSGTC
jgi:V-type H+-transporting ATPase proteolipid subunit